MKLAVVKVKVISDTTAANLEASVLAFLQGSKERTFVDVQLAVATGLFVALITYTE